ncbi:hypothetical protein [Streptomyces avicenniae]|uniref:CDI toxin immunity protein n=1 Tax=Streptomyces avicenniae TaxID=500153 RepID=UPI000699C052|nr:hypothetical protein [Streptomyces avicenniae]
MTRRHEEKAVPYVFPEALDDLLGSLSERERADSFVPTWPESQAFYGVSLRRFPATRWGALDWDSCPNIRQDFTDDWDQAARGLAAFVRTYVEADSLVVITWGNLGVPSLALPAESVAAHAEQVLATSDDIWLFAPDDNVLIEYQHDGRLTAARVADATPAQG